MALTKCPECGNIIQNNDSTCSQCGYPLNQDKPKFQKRVLIVVAILLCLAIPCVIFFYFHSIVPLQQSQQAFDRALVFENDLDYENALYYYSQVIIEDEHNYAIACKKIPELTECIDVNKSVAFLYIALENAHFASSVSDLSNIKINQSAGIMTCRIDGKNYSVSTTTDFLFFDESGGYYTKKYDPTTKKYAIEYTASYVYNSWLTESTNELRQITSDNLFDAANLYVESNCKIKLDLVSYYVNLYEECKDMSVFAT